MTRSLETVMREFEETVESTPENYKRREALKEEAARIMDGE